MSGAGAVGRCLRALPPALVSRVLCPEPPALGTGRVRRPPGAGAGCGCPGSLTQPARPRTLCDNLRRERDRAVSELAEALRSLDDTRKQKNDVSRELKELKYAGAGPRGVGPAGGAWLGRERAGGLGTQVCGGGASGGGASGRGQREGRGQAVSELAD